MRTEQSEQEIRHLLLGQGKCIADFRIPLEHPLLGPGVDDDGESILLSESRFGEENCKRFNSKGAL